MIKADIRKEMIELRKSLDAKTKEAFDKSLVDQIKNDESYQSAKVVAIYIPMRFEFNLMELTNDDKIFLIPRIENDDIVFVKYEKNMVLKKSLFGTSEPNKDIDLYCDTIDYMILPALAISRDYYRIGYGKGYYDKYVFNHRPKKIVGAIYPFQEVDKFEYDKHDQKLDGYFKGEL